MAVDYVNQQSVREEAGLQSEVLAESLTGSADGSNRVFVTRFRPLVDRNYDGVISPGDVNVYVNGAPATVASLIPATGAITLQSAPANGAVVTGDYAYSPVKDTFLTGIIEEVQGLIDERIQDIVSLPYADEDLVPKQIRLITKLWSAGLLLARDYGFNTDLSESSKDGYKKIETAEKYLDKFVERVKADESGGVDVPEVQSEGNLMSQVDSDGIARPIVDERQGGDGIAFTTPTSDSSDPSW